MQIKPPTCHAILSIAVALLALTSGARPVYAQDDDLRLPVSLDADSTAYDGKSSMVMFRGLRLTQGRLGGSLRVRDVISGRDCSRLEIVHVTIALQLHKWRIARVKLNLVTCQLCVITFQ